MIAARVKRHEAAPVRRALWAQSSPRQGPGGDAVSGRERIQAKRDLGDADEPSGLSVPTS